MHDRDLTVLKFHPLAAAHLASGDARGQIFLWHLDTPSTTGRPAAQHRPRFTKLHWHAFPVRSLGFSPDGTALISGGNEAVLVVWQLQTGKPRFRPRLGARLVQVMQSPDSRHYLVASDDNTIHLVSAVDFELEQSVFGLKSVTALVKATAGRPPVMFVCQADGVVGVQAAPGSLQLWNAASNRMLVEIDVAERPRLQCTDAGDVVGAVVLFAAMSKDGQWLATVDQRVMKTGVASGAAASGNGKFSVDAEPDHLATVTERHLKFWRKTTAGGYGFQLVTRINHPHKGDVTSLAFYPRTLQAAGNDGEQMTTHLCATSSSDGTFKVWQTAPAPPEYANTNDRTVALKAMPGKKNGKKALPAPMAASTPIALPPTWICRSTAYWRNLPASSLDFSADGSVLAVAYKNVITLWHPLTATLYRVLALAPSTIVTGVYWFGCKTKNRSRSRYLAALSSAKNSGEQCTLAVWDVVRGAVCWSRAIDDSHPLTFMDKTAGVLAIASRDTGAAAEPSWTLETFEPESSTPTLVQLFAGIVHGVGITPGDSRPKHFRAQQYIVLNGDNNLVVMEKPREDATVEATPATAGQDAAAVKWTNMLALSSSSPNLLSSILPSASAGSKAQKKAIATANAAPAPEPFDAKRRQAMLDAPSHVLPTLSGFFDLFMEKMLIGARDDTTAADNAADTSTTPVDPPQSEAMDMDQPPAMAPVAHNWSWMKSFA